MWSFYAIIEDASGTFIFIVLIHLSLDNMAAILADDNFKCNVIIPIRFSLKFVSRSPINNKLTLVQVMAWRRIGDEALPKLMMTQYADPCIWQQGEMS